MSEIEWLQEPEHLLIRTLQYTEADVVPAILAAYDDEEIKRIVAKLQDYLRWAGN